MAFPAQFDLSSLNGTNGFAINGVSGGSFVGFSVSGAGDVNGDGIDDLVIGAVGAGIGGGGESYVVFGQRERSSSSLSLASLDGNNGFVFGGAARFENLGRSVSNAGDVNGDGIDDLIVGAPYAGEPVQSGETYVIFGKSSGFNSVVNRSDLTELDGFAIGGAALFDRTAFAVSAAGDVNGDGVDDIIIATPTAPDLSRRGKSYVVFGRSSSDGSAFPQTLASINGLNGFEINGVGANDESSFSVSDAGDVNGDGFDDLIIGARSVDLNGQQDVGASYVLFGTDVVNPSINLSSLNGANGFVINGIDANDQSGYSVSSAGDLNGDGFDDLIIGAGSASPTETQNFAGESYVVFGKANGFSASLNLASLNGNNGFVINGINQFDASGRSVSGAGDVNGDGIDDLIIGARNASPNGRNYAGQSYVVFGRRSGFDAALNLSSLDGSNGFVLNGVTASDRSGYSVSGAGDVNGDGVNDLLIGATQAKPNGINVGQTYVVYGQKPPSGGDRIDGTPEADLLVGTSGNDTISGRAMDDTLQGFAGNDLLIGGTGNDSLVGGIGNDRLIGGGGADTLEGGEGQDRFSFQSIRQGIDSILDFNGVDDLVLLKQTGFDLDLPKGRLTSDRFTIGSAARDRGDRVIYNDQTGALLIDLDGRGGRDAVAIAVLSPGLELSAANFRII